jgi:DnaJ-class molecular chaperone
MSFYKILNVSKNATPELIKKAYYNLAKKYHPVFFFLKQDKKSGNESKFKEITKAYTVLIDGMKFFKKRKIKKRI